MKDDDDDDDDGDEFDDELREWESLREKELIGEFVMFMEEGGESYLLIRAIAVLFANALNEFNMLSSVFVKCPFLP